MTDPQKHSLVNFALIPSFECDVACAHCVFSSTPKLKTRLPLNKSTEAIEELHAISTVQRVTVSGGEPFLDMDYLLSVATCVCACSLKMGVVTNATFAKTISEAEKCLQFLKNVGLDSLMISWDSFHANFVDPQHVRNALRACAQLNIRVGLQCVSTVSFRLRDALAPLGEDILEVPVLEMRCLPIGRAVRKVPAAEFFPVPDADKRRPCRTDFDTLSLTADGSVYPCCAVGGFTQGISLGSVYRQTITEMLEYRDNDFRMIVLRNRGPRYFLDQATPEEMEELGVRDEMHDCVACNRLFSSSLGEPLVRRAKDHNKARAGAVIAALSRASDAEFAPYTNAEISGCRPR